MKQIHSNIVVSIGASICQECYEVGKEIYDEAKRENRTIYRGY